MAMAQAPWPRSVDLTHSFQPPLTLTMDCTHPQLTDMSQRTGPLGTQGGDPCEGSDAFPVTENPVPTSVQPPTEILWGADPSLCVTPEKPLTGSRLLTSAKSVRFNPMVEVRRRSNENSSGGNTGSKVSVHKAANASGSSLGGHDITAETGPDVGLMPLDESLGPISILACDVDRDIASPGSVRSQSVNRDTDDESLPRRAALHARSHDTRSTLDSLRSHDTGSTLDSLRSHDTGSTLDSLRSHDTGSTLDSLRSHDTGSTLDSLRSHDTGSTLDSLRSHDTGSTLDSVRSHDTGSAMLGTEFEESDAFLAKPSLNSSRWVTTELRQLQVNDLDVDLALRKKLASSSRLRSDITEKACARVNAEGGRQFVNLVSVDVCEEELVNSVAEMTTARVKPPHPARGLMTQEFGGREPDILEMVGEVGQLETPSLSLDALPSLQGQLTTVDVTCAFDVIKHIRAWESW